VTTISRTAALAAGLVCAAALAVSAAQATTIPGTITKVPVSLKTVSVQIKPDPNTKGTLSRYPRGAIINFALHNEGTKTVRVRLVATSGLKFYGASHVSKVTSEPKPLLPGRRVTFQIYFFFRAKFVLQELVDGKVRASAPIVIF
jgi:hypothetical protein